MVSIRALNRREQLQETLSEAQEKLIVWAEDGQQKHPEEMK